jgi:polyisoprenoid-binding protein YceI
MSAMAAFHIDAEASRVWVEARSSVHPVRGEGTGLQGVIDVELAGDRVDTDLPVTGRVELRVDGLKSGNVLYDTELRRVADSRRHPTIVGELDVLFPDGGPMRYRAAGPLTFHGVTRQVEGALVIEVVDGDTILVEGEGTFDVTDFGVRPPRLLMLQVHPQVTVRLAVLARRPPP